MFVSAGCSPVQASTSVMSWKCFQTCCFLDWSWIRGCPVNPVEVAEEDCCSLLCFVMITAYIDRFDAPPPPGGWGFLGFH